MNTESKRKNAYKIVMLVILTILITALITTIALYHEIKNATVKYEIKSVGQDSSSIAKTFASLKNFIQDVYIGNLDDNEMIESAIKGYVEGLGDPYSEYISPNEMKKYMEDTTGKYVGIGVYIGTNTETNQIVIVAPIKGSPAAEAGIQAEDVLLKVDGVEYKGDQLDEATEKLKQQPGTSVTLTILRGTETLDIVVERKTVKVTHVEGEVLENKIGYISISSFDSGTYEEFEAQYKKLEQQGIQSLIIDLRNNGGGIVDEATDIADLMIEKNKAILITNSKKEGEQITKAEKDRTITIPVAILVNKNTASASEILAGALKDNDNAIIIGKKTYGKGVIQTIYTLSDGSGLKLTTAEYFTPNHNTINKIGITPDEEVDLPEGTNLYNVPREKDTQLQKAIERLK